MYKYEKPLNKINFIALVKPHKSITSSTIARWLKSVLEATGVNALIFGAHSV